MSATVAFATADDYAFESIRLGTVGVAFEAERRDDPAFLESPTSVRPKNFYWCQAFFIKRGWALPGGMVTPD